MDIFTTIIGIASGIIVVVLLLAAVAPKGYTVQRSIIIDKPRWQVFDYIRFLRNQDNYSKWAMMDPDKRSSYTGTDGTEGYNAAWDSHMKQAGKGNQTIEKIIDGERVDIRIKFIKPFAGVADTYIATQDNIGGTTTVKWAFASKMPFPMNAVLLFINMEEMLGKDLEESLNNLKRVLEQQ